MLNNPLTLAAAGGVMRLGSRCRVQGVSHFRSWPRRGGIVAVNHVSHYDPVIVSALTRRRIAWWARAEFYATAGPRLFMRNAGCVRVDRGGPFFPGVRNALAALAAGRTVGLYPEGGLRGADNSVLTGGTMRAGVSTLARRADAPVLPCVVLGGHQFGRVAPWLPLRAGRLGLAFGPPLRPTAAERRPGRRGRAAFAGRVAEVLRDLYGGLTDADPELQLRAGRGEGDVFPAAGRP